MTAPSLLGELRLAQELVTALVEELDEAGYRNQYHPDLSAAGWHLGHCTFTECYWLQEVVLGDNRVTAPIAELYVPPHTPKAERGRQLPPRKVLLQWVRDLQSMHHEILADASSLLQQHPLMADDYLVHFLIQHYSQHFETLMMVLTQRALRQDDGSFTVERALMETREPSSTCNISAGHYRVGGQAPIACDNELPQQQATLGPYAIATQPVSNAQYLAFMNDGGYSSSTHWSEAGRAWLQQQQARCPEHWRQDCSGNWYGIGIRGAYELMADDVLQGICWYEAQAYANRAGARLPHEHQWEVACRLHKLEDSGRAWEWCDNRFYPYDGFQPFPYEEYSTPWFDDNHYTLRGGSLHTRPSIRRASFRNFYQPDKRHIFAGLRLVY